MVLEQFEQRYLLGHEEMDQTHREFVILLNRLNSASKHDFIPLFAELLAHTETHFATETDWMQAYAFAAIREHQSEHERVLGELNWFNRRVATGQMTMGRAYVRDQLPAWFQLHAQTMDSALAALVNAHRGQV
ncbi:MAG: hemerythrin [Gammaproteobacteria bacterium]|nr:hemerythrin [Gammaproteobacteria bacterium]